MNFHAGIKRISFLVLSAVLLPQIASAQNTARRGIWISPAEIAQLPVSGPAWENLKSEADRSTGTPDLSNQNDDVNVRIMAKALVYVRRGDESYRQDVIRACNEAIGTEQGGRTLALARELIAYVIAADLVGLPADADQKFRNWLKVALRENLSGKTLVSTHEERPNNWGTHAGGSRVAVAAYLGDTAEIERCAQIFRGWLGDRTAYAGFSYGSLAWQADPAAPVGINPVGATKSGHSIDGVLPDDQRRAGGFSWPPPKENYVYEALQGVLAQAVILSRLGYPVWEWGDQAILRAFRWLHEQASFPAAGDDGWEPHVVNFYYGTNFPAPVPAVPGKNVGWTDWTYGTRSGENQGITRLDGLVKNAATDEAVPAAAVQLRAGGQTRYGTTSGSTGRFSFTGIEPGTYQLAASKSGFLDWTGELSIAANQQIFGKVILLVPSGGSSASLSGTILNARTASGIAAATVELISGSTVAYTTSSGAGGEFTLQGISAGSYLLVIRAAGFSGHAENISLSGGEQITGRVFRLTPSGDTVPPAPPRNVAVRNQS